MTASHSNTVSLFTTMSNRSHAISSFCYYPPEYPNVTILFYVDHKLSLFIPDSSKSLNSIWYNNAGQALVGGHSSRISLSLTGQEISKVPKVSVYHILRLCQNSQITPFNQKAPQNKYISYNCCHFTSKFNTNLLYAAFLHFQHSQVVVSFCMVIVVCQGQLETLESQACIPYSLRTKSQKSV